MWAIVGALWAATALGGEASRSLLPLGGAAWRPAGDAEAVWTDAEGATFSCRFTEEGERAYWDLEARLDLSAYGRFTLALSASGAEKVRQGTLYFRSGGGWYGAWFPLREGEQRISLPRHLFRPEGRPAGWDRVDGVRLSFWKGAPGKATVRWTEFTAHRDPIVIVQGGRNREWESVRQFAGYLAGLLEDAGVPVSSVEERDVAQGVLQAEQVAVFPYNPEMDPAAVRAVERWLDGGGRAIFCYQIPESIAQRLGIEGLSWRQAEREGEFALLRLERRWGLPEEVYQGSWNVQIPELGEAEVLGVWADAEGRPSGTPGVTWHPKGVFIGHVLTISDRTAKQRLLLALIASLRPELEGSLADWLTARLGQLGELTSWEETERFLAERQQALSPEQREQLMAFQEAAQSARREAQEARARGAFDRFLESYYRAREALASAYYSSLIPWTEGFRAVWCHDARGVPGWSWEQALRYLKEHGFHAVFPNMLWGGLAYYPSEVLPHAPEVQEGRDLIAECLEAARAVGIEVHVWKVNWNLSTAPPEFVERMRREGRLQADRDGREIPWLSPSHPANFQMELESLLEVVRNYPVDGIHFDYIRYPHDQADYSPGARERFEAAVGQRVRRWPEDVLRGGPLYERFADWRREQITRLVRAVSQEARKIRPGIKISAAVFRDYPNCRETVGQDWVAWAQAGYLDFVCPMNYLADNSVFRRTVRMQLEHLGGAVPLISGIGASAPGLAPEVTTTQAWIARQLGAAGFILFNYDRSLVQEHLPAFSLGLTRPQP
ncbi:MAG: hypothetical protein KatS3mg115_1693 [Candidatus Poribacteria bacterium]|nr:MAG: hypothetical protein KatS3mg115_1693 [Candidatus Poribacteria bacterium]